MKDLVREYMDKLDSRVDPRGYSDEDQYWNDRENSIKNKDVDRKGMPVYSGVLSYFPDAIKEVSKASAQGQKQHNHGKKLYWDKNKSTDNEDALLRHLIDHTVDPMDKDGVLHLAKVCWRALAALQIYLENNKE
tara:strand:+ start:1786 stop:2187 length:402 start_codon:yes stop_codon:yes gene_type:complete